MASARTTQGCARWRDDLTAFVLGALDGEARAAMKRHLADCAECRAHYEDLVHPPLAR